MFELLKPAKLIVFAFILFTAFQCYGQAAWLSGYRYRKVVTFNNAMVAEGDKDKSFLTNFTVLVQLEDPDLRYDAEAFDHKILNPNAYDIAFATTANSGTPLKFQLESYDPATGKLLCWLEVPKLYTITESYFKTTVYLYYGSEKLYNPLDEQLWNATYHQIDHLGRGGPGMISTGAAFNGSSDLILKAPNLNIAMTVSVWIKPDQIGQEQVIFSNDTSGRAGYQLKIDDAGKLVFEVFDFARGKSVFSGSTILSANQWYYVSVSVKINGNANSIGLYLNGTSEYSRTSNFIFLSSAGSVVIGASKQGDRYFKGAIDEWRMGVVRANAFIKTEYLNQRNPAAFSSAGLEEVNPGMEAFSYVFTGIQGSSWTKALNWSPKVIPSANKSIRIQQGKTVDVPSNMVMNQLLVEKGATVNLLSNLSVTNRVILESGALVSGEANARLELQGDLRNDGQIMLDKANARLHIYGSRNALMLKGSGMLRTSKLEIDLPAADARLTLQMPLQVTSSLQIFKGILNTGGNLQLPSVEGKTAMIYPLEEKSSIQGSVSVQYQVNGSFPAPSSGRGWRLMSSPVYQFQGATGFEFNFKDLQKSIFVTGAGGAANGFDASPNNGATIYSHNQALPGTLTQKYLPIPDMESQVALGRGFFVFSRGSRLLPDAYQQQIQTRPFANAAPYLITYTGRLFAGELTVQVFNKDEGGEGDGFNLLGNPYAAPVRWGSLIKHNVSANVWLFDPLNNSYLVSNDPETIIPAGTGFFVLVNPGFKTGSVQFTESAKVLP